MVNRRVLVAFSSRTGSTAGTASLIAAELCAAGLSADLRPAAEVADIGGYDAIVLGSGMFVASRASDGGGFLARFAPQLASRKVWLFCVGPIGRERARGAGRDCGVAAVGRAIGARGVAAFGTPGLGSDADAVLRMIPVNPTEVRVWAQGIAADLLYDTGPHIAARRAGHTRHHRAIRGLRPGLAAVG